mgnify:FL=1
MRRICGDIGVTGYVLALYGFIYLPVLTLVLFSFQEGRFPIPPFNGPSLRWYEAVFADGKLSAALGNSLLVAALSSALACLFAFLAADGIARFRLAGAGPV